MNKAKDEAMVTFAKKVRRTGQEYAFVHQDEFTSEYITKDITEIMGDSGNYEGEIDISKDGSVDILFLKSKGENKIICYITSNQNITTSDIQNARSCPSDGGGSR
jgi:hypothetical protein